MVSSIFYFHPYLGKWSNLTNIFQMGWNHQLGGFRRSGSSDNRLPRRHWFHDFDSTSTCILGCLIPDMKSKIALEYSMDQVGKSFLRFFSFGCRSRSWQFFLALSVLRPKSKFDSTCVNSTLHASIHVWCMYLLIFIRCETNDSHKYVEIIPLSLSLP